MAVVKRVPFQGVLNIVRFNWHIYALAMASWIFAAILILRFPSISIIMAIYLVLSSLSLLVSLVISYYIYDQSPLYELPWVNNLASVPLSIINIHAGFDETSAVLQNLFPKSTLKVYDFYDPKLHTEVSVKRARAAYPPHPNTIKISTNQGLPMDAKADLLCLLFSAHEIRDASERINFFTSLKKHLNENGTMVVMEHLRDIPNLLAYNIGALHFYSKATWEKCFDAAGWRIVHSQKITPFIQVYFLHCHD